MGFCCKRYLWKYDNTGKYIICINFSSSSNWSLPVFPHGGALPCTLIPRVTQGQLFSPFTGTHKNEQSRNVLKKSKKKNVFAHLVSCNLFDPGPVYKPDHLFRFQVSVYKEIVKKWKRFPIPGIEPGPPGWKPGILTARPYGNLLYVLFVRIC